MLKFENDECVAHLMRVREWASEKGYSRQLNQVLAHLDGAWTQPGEDRETVHIYLFPDLFHPSDFSFRAESRQPDGSYKLFLHGGVIFHEHSGSWGVHT